MISTGDGVDPNRNWPEHFKFDEEVFGHHRQRDVPRAQPGLGAGDPALGG